MPALGECTAKYTCEGLSFAVGENADNVLVSVEVYHVYVQEAVVSKSGTCSVVFCSRCSDPHRTTLSLPWLLGSCMIYK